MEAWELGNVYCMEIDTNTDGDELSAVLGKVCEPQTTASMVQPLSHTHTCTHRTNQQAAESGGDSGGAGLGIMQMIANITSQVLVTRKPTGSPHLTPAHCTAQLADPWH